MGFQLRAGRSVPRATAGRPASGRAPMPARANVRHMSCARSRSAIFAMPMLLDFAMICVTVSSPKSPVS
ncbi:hypothetical protein DP42_6412 [Burkholderia pseudomallei]|nr:hypothetical protein DP42_6412 [Burkholderia pseudomallei]KOT25465.1 hypothetical protein DM52_4589 [Burkholderia mallei]VBE95099.1 Uncharacterised protein [Burkholderia pseudomallei]